MQTPSSSNIHNNMSVWVGLHGITNSQPVWRWERKGFMSLLPQRILAIGENWSAEFGSYVLDLALF